jgi:hypothetical protein
VITATDQLSLSLALKKALRAEKVRQVCRQMAQIAPRRQTAAASAGKLFQPNMTAIV